MSESVAEEHLHGRGHPCGHSRSEKVLVLAPDGALQGKKVHNEPFRPQLLKIISKL